MEKILTDLKIEEKSSLDITQNISQIVEQSRRIVYATVDVVLLQRNWLIGKRIHEEILNHPRKDNYGQKLIESISINLQQKFGSGFDKKSLYKYVKFYTLYTNIFASVRRQSFLSWTHYRILLKIENKKERDWYEKEALESGWSVRTLQRNINTQYFQRLLSSQIKEPVIKEMEEKTSEYQNQKLEHIKNPMIFEFFGVKGNEQLLESTLESLIISNIQKVLLELGKGYSFVGRQYHIQTDSNDYYVDLVFYNYLLRCFVLIDLKTDKITHQDVGQMDMYVRMFDELVKKPDDNPTLGIVLCSETDADIAKYSILKGNEQLFATKYKLYLPSEIELRAEIEHQKELFYLSLENKNA